MKITCLFALLALGAASHAPTAPPTFGWNGCIPGTTNVEHSDASKSFLWIAFLGLALPGIFFSCKAMSMSPGVDRKYGVVTAFICLIAALAYLTMATGYGSICIAEKDKGSRIFTFARYIDWSLTTPLQLADLCHLGGADESVMYFLMGTDFLMIVAGLIGGLLGVVGPAAAATATYDDDDLNAKWMFWFFGMAAFLPIVFMLFRMMGTAPKETSGAYNKIAILTIVTWSFYPVVWVFAEGTGSLSEDQETIAYTVLDILAKSLFGLIVIMAPRSAGTPASGQAM